LYITLARKEDVTKTLEQRYKRGLDEREDECDRIRSQLETLKAENKNNLSKHLETLRMEKRDLEA